MAMVDPQDARAERDREETQERNERKRERKKDTQREKGIYERNSKNTGSSVQFFGICNLYQTGRKLIPKQG